MGRITMELLRKRSEHNEGEIHSLEELALHQEKLEKIELVDKVCRNLKILLLQNNAISKIENVSRLKNLEYLNLALNTVERIENLEGCESLKKLDLTLNFIAELTTVKSLRDLPHLEQLYLVGNPCHDFPGYRDYVIGALPQLKSLDGREISKSERIKAFQVHDQLQELIIKQQERYFIDHEDKPPQHHGTEELSAKESAESTTTTSGKASDERDEDEDDEEFWNRKSPDTPEVRKELIRRIERQEEKKRPKDTRKPRVPRRLTNADGKPLNINEAKISFSLHDECERSQLVLDLAVPKHMCTTLIDADVQPFHVKVTMKGKIFQLVLPEEVKPDSSFAQRSQVTGHLLITMPKVYETSSIVWQGRDTNKVVDLSNRSRSSNSPHSRSSAHPNSQPVPGSKYPSSQAKVSSVSSMRSKGFVPSSPTLGRIEKSASAQPPSSLAVKGRQSNGNGGSGGRRHSVNFNIGKGKSGGLLEKDVPPLM